METKLTIFNRTFSVYYNRTERMWIAVEFDSQRNIVWIERSSTRDMALVYIGIEAGRK